MTTDGLMSQDDIDMLLAGMGMGISETPSSTTVLLSDEKAKEEEPKIGITDDEIAQLLMDN